jgi:D-amino-acid dehydrogenase
MQAKAVDILIIGGGVVGATMALDLQKQGVQVLLIDKGDFGKGCSFANAGWVTPCFSMPLPQPGMLLKATKWLLDPASPLYIKPEFSLNLFSWLTRFLLAMNEKKMVRSIEVLTAISKYSLESYRALAQSSSHDFSFANKGLILASGEKTGLKAAQKELELMQQMGIAGEFMGQEALLAFEPALKPILKGGVYFPHEAQVEPFALTQTLIKEFQKLGGEAMSGLEVINLKKVDNRISEVVTTHGNFRPKLVVMAAGTWSKNLVELLGCKIPLLGGKGYSMSVHGDFVKPTRSIMIVEKKIAVTPYDNYMRLAGTLELVNQDFDFSAKRVQAIENGARQYLNLEGVSQIDQIWRGLRPCTPDGVPMIGFSSKISNLFYSVGHQMLGLQSAAGSAKLASELILNKTPYVDPIPFKPSRYER